MAAYIVGRMHIQHRDWWDEYFAEVPALITQHSGKFLVRGGAPETLEGPSACPMLCLLSNSQAKPMLSHSGTLPNLRHSSHSDKPAPL